MSIALLGCWTSSAVWLNKCQRRCCGSDVICWFGGCHEFYEFWETDTHQDGTEDLEDRRRWLKVLHTVMSYKSTPYCPDGSGWVATFGVLDLNLPTPSEPRIADMVCSARNPDEFFPYKGKDVWYTCRPDVPMDPRLGSAWCHAVQKAKEGKSSDPHVGLFQYVSVQ